MKIKSYSTNYSKTFNVLISVAILFVYLVLDGFSMFLNSYYVFIGRATGNSITLTELMKRADSSYIISTMLSLQISRVIGLILVLFPIIYFVLCFRIKFKINDDSNLKRLIPYLRLLFGLLFFYYAMTIRTTFTHELFTNFYSFGHWISFFRIVGAFILLGTCILDYRSAFNAVKAFPVSHPKLYKGLFIISISIISCMLLEFQAGSKMNMMTYMLFYSILYWVILQVVIDLITCNVKVGAFVSLILSYLIGLINDVVYQFRGNYIMYGDLTVVRTALEVSGNYKYKPGVWFWVSLALLISAGVFTVILKFPKHKGKNIKELIVRLVAVAVISATVVITFNNGLLYNRIFGVGWDYNTNVRYAGYMPYFMSNMNAIAGVELEGYDAQLAKDALDTVSSRNSELYSSPNIIIIQNEAFSDLSVLYDIETNKDYMPYIHSLTENTQKGYLNMSITGGPTANTEFEVLTRSTLNFLPYGSVPYTQYINADIPSVPQVLENQPVPYHTVAYHPYYSSGYSRTNVYNHFGFDEIIFENDFRTDFPESELPRNYLSDSADYRRVEQMYEEFRNTSEAPWFCFNVTIQNHGGYTLDYFPDVDDQIYVTNFEATDSINEYLSLVKESDDAFREIIEYFSQCEEPTIIAMYGDHQPSLDDDALDVLADHTGDQLNSYYVPYVIWANYDIEEVNTLGDADHDPVMNTLSTNYFASYVFSLAGIELSDYDRYLLDLHERIPAITAIGVWDNEGNYYPSIDSCPYVDELSALRMIQYNLIFDDDNRLTDRYI